MAWGSLSLSACCFAAACVVLVWTPRLRDRIINAVLNRWYAIKTIHGAHLPGPDWQWNHGQMAEKFIMGREKSAQWSSYGPVYRIWAGLKPEIVLTDPLHVREFFSGSRYHKAACSNMGWYMHQILGDCLGLINGARWARLRGELERSFSKTATRGRVGWIVQFAKEYVGQIGEKYPEDQDTKTVRIKVVEVMQAYPFFQAAEVIYGKLEEDEKQELWDMGKQRLPLMRFVIKGGVYRSVLSAWLRLGAMKELTEFTNHWRQFNIDKVQQQRQKSSPGLIEHLWRGVEAGEISENEALQTIDEMLFANLDVAVHVISWMTTLLANSEGGYQQKLWKEVIDHQNDLEDYIQRNDTLLHGTFLESLRLRPAIAFTIPEHACNDKIVGGVLIPANTDIVVDAFAINIRNPFWGSDSTEFKPDRFLHVKSTDLRYNLVSFGFSRKCLGQHEAMVGIKALIAHILLSYTLNVKNGQAQEGGGFKVVDNNWIPIADVELALQTRSG